MRPSMLLLALMIVSELQKTPDNSVSFKMDVKNHCNKCSTSKNCFKNYLNIPSKKDKPFSSMLAREKRESLVNVDMFAPTDIHNKVDEPNKCDKRSASKRLEEKQIGVKMSSKKDKDASRVLTRECSGLIPVIVHMLPLININDHINGGEGKLRRSSGRVIKHRKCEVRLNKIKLSSRQCDIKISSIDLKRHLQRKRSRVNLKRLKLPHGLGGKISSENNNSRFNSRVGLNRLKPNPKTLKQRKTNDEILRHFSQDHCDDMFEAKAIPSYVSKFNLMETSFSSNTSDEDGSSLAQPHTPLTKHLAHFGGWSAQTPDHVRGEDEDGEVKQAEGELSQLAFVHKTLHDRKKGQKVMGKRIPNNLEDILNSAVDLDCVFSSEKSSTPRKSRPQTLKDFLGDLEPALENLSESQQDMSMDEVEPYFEES